MLGVAVTMVCTAPPATPAASTPAFMWNLSASLCWHYPSLRCCYHSWTTHSLLSAPHMSFPATAIPIQFIATRVIKNINKALQGRPLPISPVLSHSTAPPSLVSVISHKELNAFLAQNSAASSFLYREIMSPGVNVTSLESSWSPKVLHFKLHFCFVLHLY